MTFLAFSTKITNCRIVTPSSLAISVDVPDHCSHVCKTSIKISSGILVKLPLGVLNVESFFFKLHYPLRYLLVIVCLVLSDFTELKMWGTSTFNYPQVSFQSQLQFEFQLDVPDHAIRRYFQVVDLKISPDNHRV